MSTTETRISLHEAQELVAEVGVLLSPVCTRMVVAGSIRREKPDIGDLEIVCIPQIVEADPGQDLDLFGQAPSSASTPPRNRLDERCTELLLDGTFHGRLDKHHRAAIGSKYKRLLYRGVGLDLFSTTAEQWGVILAIRTGPADFSHRFVTVRRQGGVLPDWLLVKDGQLRYRTTGEVIPTPEEIDFLNAIDYGWIEPQDRH